MISNDPKTLDLTSYDQRSDHRRPPGPSGLHLLRLTLDLQLDAMLLTLGAAAHAQVQGGVGAVSEIGVEGTDEDRGGVPWRRWLMEDLDLARALTATLHEADAAPVPGLGGSFAKTCADTSLDYLAARYESMERLLLSVLEQASGGQRWHAQAAEALQRCRARLTELHHHRGVSIATVNLRATFLPGELLG